MKSLSLDWHFRKKPSVVVSRERMFEILRRPIVTEKTTLIQTSADTDKRQYSFIVANDANKFEVKAAIEGLFGVKVAKVTTANYQGKIKRFRGRLGRRNDYKKATVTLQAGAELDVTAKV